MAEANKPVPKAKVTVFGKVRLSVAPVDPENPIAVGDNDPRLGTNVYGSQVGIVAGTTQTQAGATQLTKKRNIVSTVANANDGVKAAQAVENMEQYVKNEGANTMKFYPYLGDRFLGLPINTPIDVLRGMPVTVYCYEGETGILRYR